MSETKANGPFIHHWNMPPPRTITKRQEGAIKRLAIRLAKKYPLNIEWRLPPKGRKP